MRRILSIISLLAINVSTSFGLTEYYAYLVGIEEYPGTGYDLPYSINDITDVKNMLIQVGDWPEDNIYVHTNSQATEYAMNGAMSMLQDSVDSDDVFLFMFSGSGDNSPAGLVPYDTDNRITPVDLYYWLDGFATNKIIVILDASFEVDPMAWTLVCDS